MAVLQVANLAIRFLLEVCALLALGQFGLRIGRGPAVRFIIGMGAPLLAATVWALFVAPNASIPAPDLVRFAVEFAVFGSAVAALYVSGHPKLAIAFALIIAVNRILMTLWGQ